MVSAAADWNPASTAITPVGEEAAPLILVKVRQGRPHSVGVSTMNGYAYPEYMPMAGKKTQLCQLGNPD